MKKLLPLIIIMYSITLQAQNFGFEDGNFNDWDLYYGQNDRDKIFGFCFKKGISNIVGGQNSPNYHNLESQGFDPLLGSSILPKVIEGNFSARIGSNGTDTKKASRLSKTFIVTSSEPYLKINYAIVTTDPSHNSCENPYFLMTLKKSNGSQIYSEYIISDYSNPYFKQQGAYLYKDWDCIKVDLSNYIGQDLTIDFTVADCSQGANTHFTYVYIDGLNKDAIEPIFTLDKQVYCKDDIVYANASDSKGEIDHFWSIEESDENGNRIPSTEVNKWFVATQANSINLTDLYTSLGGSFKCNKWYNIKLAVKNNCVQWKETTQLISFSCPKVDAGKDLCCTNLTSMPVLGGLDANPNYTYEWFPKYGLSHPYGSKTFIDCDNEDINEFDCFNYTLRATDQNGCFSEDEVIIHFSKPDIDIIQSQSCCNNKLEIRRGCHTSVLWSTGETTNSINVTEPGIYSVTASNSCSSSTKSVTVNTLPAVNLSRNLWDNANKGFWYSNGSNVNANNSFIITHVQNPQPNSGIYFATEYKLDIYSRGGQIIHTIEKAVTNCNGFSNNDIKWDGKINGQQVQSGVYNARLYLKNCFHNEWVPIEVTYCNGYETVCLDLRCEGGLGFKCGFFKVENCYKIGKICNDERRHNIFPINIQF
ncbi:hypothetical protein [Zobellia laminariae]|uniref:hypothetical protein n=1 Tax=Zobellia laminariae TaxID=248906 RepID=UPI0026F40E1D|nr:hypothetical protein [Zobellia laminariae]WKX76367.1 hypothetical protein Q5W13_22935 [Zobellia laminariae]